jgi:hypothetical protein
MWRPRFPVEVDLQPMSRSRATTCRWTTGSAAGRYGGSVGPRARRCRRARRHCQRKRDPAAKIIAVWGESAVRWSETPISAGQPLWPAAPVGSSLGCIRTEIALRLDHVCADQPRGSTATKSASRTCTWGVNLLPALGVLVVDTLEGRSERSLRRQRR